MSGGSPPAERLVSLDAFRGLTIAAMILVNHPGSWKHVHPPLAHAPWHGVTPTDLIFPNFVFIVGVAIPFAFRKRLRATSKTDLFGHVTARAARIVAIGLLMNATAGALTLAQLRIPGVLQRIGVVYLLASALYLFTSRLTRAGIGVALLVGYFVAMSYVPVPGYGPGDLSPEGNLASYIDRQLLGGHLFRPEFDPEGILSTLPAVVTCLLGVAVGEWLRHPAPKETRVKGLLLGGALTTLAGMLWSPAFPMNKSLWTSSYTLFTGGLAILSFAGLYWLVDVRRVRGPWLTPTLVFGTNAIVAYFGAHMLGRVLATQGVAGSVVSALSPVLGTHNASMVYGLGYVGLWLLALMPLYRRRIFITV